MKKLAITIVVTGSALISGCYSYGGWQPTVDTYNDRNAYRLNQDMAECKQLALQASGGTTSETAKGAAVGGLLGAATGAVAGALAGSPGTGAAIGAAAGGGIGAAKQGFGSESTYQNAYKNCLRSRGHNVLN